MIERRHYALVVLFAAVTGAAHAQSFGRLFSTPEQRIQLDEVREEYEYGKPPRPPEPEVKKDDSQANRPALPQVTVNGVVLRSSGNDTSWVNGTRILSGQTTPEGIRIEPRRVKGPAVKLVLPSGVGTTPIKPGQRIDIVSGTVVETYRAPKDGTSSARAQPVFDEQPGERSLPVPAPPAKAANSP